MMDFTEEFEFLERELNFDFDDKDLRNNQKKIAELDRRLEQILKDPVKFPTLSSSTIKRSLKALIGSSFISRSVITFETIAREEVQNLRRIPEQMWSSFNTLNIMNPGKIPASVVRLVNSRMREYDRMAKEIGQLLRKKSANPQAFTNQDQDLLDTKLEHIRYLEANFLQGIDEHTVKLVQVFSKSISNLDDMVDSADLALKGISDTANNIQSTGGALFQFLRTGNSLPQLASSIKMLLSNGYKAYLQVFLKELEQGKRGDDRRLTSMLAGKRVPGAFTKVLTNLGSDFIHHILKFAGPYGKLAALAVSIATYFISKRQERIEFNNLLTKSVGLIDGLAMQDYRIKDPEKRMEAYYTTVFDYFADRDTEYTVTLPNGLSVTKNSNSIDLNLDSSKYAELLGDLVQAGVTLRDLEQEFGTASVKPNLLGNVRTDIIPNLKSPLEEYYTVAKAFNMDPAEVAKVYGDWKYNYGDLMGSITESFAEIYKQSSYLGVNSKDLLINVVDLSNSFSVYSNQSMALSKALGKIIQRGIYGLEQGKKLLEGVLTEVRGFSIGQLENLLVQMQADRKGDLSVIRRFVDKARSNLNSEISKKQKELASKSLISEKDQLRIEIATLTALRDNATARIKDLDLKKFDPKHLAGFFDGYAQTNLTLNLDLLDAAIAGRRKAFIKTEKNRRGNLALSMVDTSNTLSTLGLESEKMVEWAQQQDLPVAARVFQGPINPPAPFDNQKALDIMQRAALNLIVGTESFTSQYKATTEPLVTKIYNAALSMWRQVQDLTGQLFGAAPDKQPETIKKSGHSVKDVSFAMPSELLKKPPLPKVQKIVLGRDTEFSRAITESKQKKTTAKTIKTSHHYGITEEGTLEQYLPESMQATGLGKLKSKLGDKLQKGLDVGTFALSINIAPPPKGNQKKLDKYYLALADTLSSLLIQYNLNPADVVTQESLSGLGELPKDVFNKLKQYTQASYDIKSKGGQGVHSTPSRAVDQITSNMNLQNLFNRAFTGARDRVREESQQLAAYGRYSTVEDFSAIFLESLSYFTTDTLKKAMKTDGEERDKVKAWFIGRFGLVIGADMTLLFEEMLKRAVASRPDTSQLPKITVKPKLQDSLTKVSDIIGEADLIFRSAFAEKLTGSPQAAIITQHLVDIYFSDTKNELRIGNNGNVIDTAVFTKFRDLLDIKNENISIPRLSEPSGPNSQRLGGP